MFAVRKQRTVVPARRAPARLFWHSFIHLSFVHALTRYHPFPRFSNSPPTHNRDTTDTQKSPSEPKIFDFSYPMERLFDNFLVYLNYFLYLCTRICKMVNCVATCDQINERKRNKFAYIKKKLYLCTQFCVRHIKSHIKLAELSSVKKWVHIEILTAFYYALFLAPLNLASSK